MPSRAPARQSWMVVEDRALRRSLVDQLLTAGRVQVNKKKLFNHGVPEDVAIAGVEYATQDEPDPKQEGWYNSTWNSPKGPLHTVYFIEVRDNDEKILKIFDAYPRGREIY